MADILPRDLQPVPGGTVLPNTVVIIDDGAGVYKATVEQVAATGTPLASSAEVVAGSSVQKYLNPERTVEAINTHSPVRSVNGQTGVVILTKGDIGLGNVENLAPANYPVSTDQAAAIATAVTDFSNDLATTVGASMIGAAAGGTVQDWIDQGGGGGGSGVFPYGGASATFTSIHVESTTGVITPINWDSTTRDTDGFWSAAAPSRFTVPAGVSKVRLSCMVSPDSSDPLPASNNFRILKNSNTAGVAGVSLPSGGYTNPDGGAVSDALDVVAGDYFTLTYQSTESFALNLDTWFSIEVIERDAANVGMNLNLSDLLDVDIPAPQDGDALLYDSASGGWVSGTPTVNIPVVADYRGPFKGALAKFNTTKTSATLPFIPSWDTTEYDTDGFWSAAAPSRLTIPAGISKVRLIAMVSPSSGFSDGENAAIGIRKNGSFGVGLQSVGAEMGYGDSFLQYSTPVISVTTSDYFDVRFNTNGSGSKVYGAGSFFSIEVIEYEITP